MRVVSIREPYATLIKNKIKYIETRSWNTHYRGEIYIHSCKGKYPMVILCAKQILSIAYLLIKNLLKK